MDIVLIGPDEPLDTANHPGPFGAHYDEARILVARGDAPSVALTWLTIEGMAQLEHAARESLIVRSGALEIIDRGDGTTEMVDDIVAVPAGATRLEEPPPQGYFNPRRYISAALSDAQAHGALIERTSAVNLGHSGGRFTVECGDVTVAADQVVIAAGAWSNRLLPRPVALRLKQESVLFAELDEPTAAVVTMQPTVFHGLSGNVESIYTLPPIRYPNGRWYLKLGANTLHDRAVNPIAIDAWYRDGKSLAQEDLEAAFASVFPRIEPRGFHVERCVITYTPHGRPYIAALDTPGLFIAAAGNGHGASWADGAGQLAARCVAGEPWPSGLEPAAFAVAYQDAAPAWPAPLLLAERLG